MAAIRRNDIQVLFKGLSEQLGPGSVRNVYDVLVRVMTAAVEDKVIASSPCRRITLPPMADEEVTPPTVAQVEAMARVMPPYIRAAIVTLAGSGLRIGELLGLKVSDVDFKAAPFASNGSASSPGRSARRRPPSPGVPSRSARSSRTRS
jgi:integrase